MSAHLNHVRMFSLALCLLAVGSVSGAACPVGEGLTPAIQTRWDVQERRQAPASALAIYANWHALSTRPDEPAIFGRQYQLGPD